MTPEEAILSPKDAFQEPVIPYRKSAIPHTPTIGFAIGDVQFTALLDSGSQMNFISQKIGDRIDISRYPYCGSYWENQVGLQDIPGYKVPVTVPGLGRGAKKLSALFNFSGRGKTNKSAL